MKGYLVAGVCGVALVVVGAAHLLWPRVETRTVEASLSAKPTAVELRRVFRGVSPISSGVSVNGGRPFRCSYVDDTHDKTDVEHVTAAVQWCLRISQREFLAEVNGQSSGLSG